ATYEWYRNVQDDAFETAVETLKARVATFGKDSPIVRDWIAAQDQVFAVGGVGQDKRPSPLAPLKADAPALARADRTYQIASEHFYAGEFSQARDAYQAIARDQVSPWHDIAPYLATRALLRSAVIDSGDPAETDRRLAQSIDEFNTLASSATSSD